MKKIAFFILALTLIACNNKTEKKSVSQENDTTKEKVATIPISSNDTEINILVKDTIDDNMMLLGKITRKGLKGKEFIEWHKENFNGHTLDTITIESLKPELKDVSIQVFMGTWCSDSQREVPALFKILDATKYDYTKLEIVAVSHEKETPNHLEKGMDIQYVPTIILYKKGEEIGRYVEFAQEDLEKDLLSIINEDGYKHSYEE